MIKIELDVVEDGYEGKKLFDNIMLEGNGAKFGLPKLKSYVSATCPDCNLSNFDVEKFCTDCASVGKLVQVSVKITTQKKGEYAGQKSNNVVEYLPYTQGSFM